MPLIHSSSESALRSNIATEIRAGRPQAQAVAIGLSTGRKAWRKKHPTGPFPHHLRRTGAYRASRSNRAYPISYSDGRSIADPIVMIWDDLSTERRGNWYRAHWQESPESTTGSPVFGYASGQGGPHRTQRAAANEVWRYYPGARIYSKSGTLMKKNFRIGDVV